MAIFTLVREFDDAIAATERSQTKRAADKEATEQFIIAFQREQSERAKGRPAN